jgi:hypothetical protein
MAGGGGFFGLALWLVRRRRRRLQGPLQRWRHQLLILFDSKEERFVRSFFVEEEALEITFLFAKDRGIVM